MSEVGGSQAALRAVRAPNEIDRGGLTENARARRRYTHFRKTAETASHGTKPSSVAGHAAPNVLVASRCTQHSRKHRAPRRRTRARDNLECSRPRQRVPNTAPSLQPNSIGG